MSDAVVTGALVTVHGDIEYREAAPLEGRTGPDAAALLLGRLRSLRDRAAAAGRAVSAVGVSVPGIVHPVTGRLHTAGVGGWDGYPLRDELSAEVGDAAAVRVDGEGVCSVLGECWKGVARGCRDVVFLGVGSGIGAGIVADGRVLRGHTGAAGAAAWLALDRNDEAGDGACACFERHASAAALVRAARERLAADPAAPSRLRVEVAEPAVTTRDVFDAYDAGDALAQSVVDDAVVRWGMATANLVSLFNPELVVFGGATFGPAVRYLECIAAEARRWADPWGFEHVRLAAAELGGDAPLVGAASLAVEALRTQ